MLWKSSTRKAYQVVCSASNEGVRTRFPHPSSSTHPWIQNPTKKVYMDTNQIFLGHLKIHNNPPPFLIRFPPLNPCLSSTSLPDFQVKFIIPENQSDLPHFIKPRKSLGPKINAQVGLYSLKYHQRDVWNATWSWEHSVLAFGSTHVSSFLSLTLAFKLPPPPPLSPSCSVSLYLEMTVEMQMLKLTLSLSGCRSITYSDLTVRGILAPQLRVWTLTSEWLYYKNRIR